MDYHQLGSRVRMTRKQKGLTQEKLAELINVSVPYVSHIERGCKRPSLETILRISVAMSVSIDYLLTGSIAAGAAAFLPEVENLLKGCLPHERQIIFDVAEATKQSLQVNRWAA